MNTTKEKTANLDERANWPTVKLPRVLGKGAPQQREVVVNFKIYLVQTGTEVKVPPEVYEVLKQSELAEDAAYQYADENKLREA